MDTTVRCLAHTATLTSPSGIWDNEIHSWVCLRCTRRRRSWLRQRRLLKIALTGRPVPRRRSARLVSGGTCRHKPEVIMKLTKFKKYNKCVYRHSTAVPEWLDMHRFACREAVTHGHSGIREILPHLFHRASDERNLLCAWDWVMQKSGLTAGSDGETAQTLARVNKFESMRNLRDAIRNGDYRPDKTLTIQIEKKNGNGKRTIHILTILDRIVQLRSCSGAPAAARPAVRPKLVRVSAAAGKAACDSTCRANRRGRIRRRRPRRSQGCVQPRPATTPDGRGSSLSQGFEDRRVH